MVYIVWTMEDDVLWYLGNVDWDTMETEWETHEEFAGLFYAEEVDDLEEYYDDLHAEEVG